MKRILFITLMAMFSISLFAQTSDLDKVLFVPIDNESDVEVSAEGAIDTQRRSKSTGIYYAKPYGMMYRTYYSYTGLVYIRSEYLYPAGKAFTYLNLSNDRMGTIWNYKTGIDEGTDMTSDADGNISFAIMPTYSGAPAMYAMYLYSANRAEHYCMGYEDNDGGDPDGWIHPIYASGYINDVDSQLLGYTDNGLFWAAWADNKAHYANSSYYDSYYAYGTGSRTMDFYVTDKNGKSSTINATFPRNSVEQKLPAPAIPMYVDGIYIVGFTYAFDNVVDASDWSFQPLRNGATLTLNIYDQETNKLLETLTATTGDWTGWSITSGNSYRSGTYMTGALKFSKKDENGEEQPFIIDGATTIEIIGLYNDDIDLGFKYNKFQDCDNDPHSDLAYNYFIDPSGEYTISRNSAKGFVDACLSLNFNSVMDAVIVEEETANITISTDGTECTNSDGNDVGGVLVQTALAWDCDIANYCFADAPEWIMGITAERYGYDRNMYKLTIQADENVGAERTAVVHIQCLGYVDDVDITITQSSAIDSDGISIVSSQLETTKASATYNVAGQRVSDTAKGIIIKDGKKVMKVMK